MTELGWIFSRIDGDPVQGPGIKCYATTMRNADVALDVVMEDLKDVANSLRSTGYNVLREKIEMVVHDERFT